MQVSIFLCLSWVQEQETASYSGNDATSQIKHSLWQNKDTERLIFFFCYLVHKSNSQLTFGEGIFTEQQENNGAKKLSTVSTYFLLPCSQPSKYQKSTQYLTSASLYLSAKTTWIRTFILKALFLDGARMFYWSHLKTWDVLNCPDSSNKSPPCGQYYMKTCKGHSQSLYWFYRMLILQEFHPNIQLQIKLAHFTTLGEKTR